MGSCIQVIQSSVSRLSYKFRKGIIVPPSMISVQKFTTDLLRASRISVKEDTLFIKHSSFRYMSAEHQLGTVCVCVPEKYVGFYSILGLFSVQCNVIYVIRLFLIIQQQCSIPFDKFVFKSSGCITFFSSVT